MAPLDLRQLRYFVAVAENGQLTDAARRLEIAQPTLSQALAQLEARLGIELLERHTRGVRLTDAGRVFLEKARAAVAAADEAAEAANAFGRAQSRVLAVAFHRLPLTRWAAIFNQLSQAHPGTRLRWEPLDFPVERRSPIEEVDVGLLMEPTPRPGLSSLILHREPRAVLMAATHPLADRPQLTIADVLDETWPGCHPAIDRQWRSFWTLDRERGGPARMTEERVMSAAEGLEAVISGKAIATVPVGLAEAFAHPGIVGVPLVDATPTSLTLVWRTEHDNPLVDALVRIAKAHASVAGKAPSAVGTSTKPAG